MWSRKFSTNILFRNITTKLYKSDVKAVLGTKDMCRLKHSTIDTNEVKHFSDITQGWGDVQGPLRLLHAYNDARIPIIIDRFGTGETIGNKMLLLKNQTILDVGCGGGILSEELAKHGAKVTGIDPTGELIDIAQDHTNLNPHIADNKPTYYNCTIEEHIINFANYYDGIIASEVIEHVLNPELFVRSCIQALKPGGKILFTTPNRTRWSQFVMIFLCEDVLGIIPKGMHQYEKFLTPGELTTMIERNKCTVEYSFGISCNPITKRFRATTSQRMLFVLQALKPK